MLNRNWSSAGSLAQPRGAVPAAAARGLGQRFGNLQVRPKLIVLHNLFFLTLAVAVYLAVIPAFERRVSQAKLIEISLITQLFSSDRPHLRLPQMEGYHFAEGTAAEITVPREVRRWLEENPHQVWNDSPRSDYLYLFDRASSVFRRVTLPNLVYDQVVNRAKWALILVLGLLYLLAVVMLELVIMPRYVYIPLRLMVDADEATRRGDRERELIPETLILEDEIGTIMRSRNQTVAELRQHEDELADALNRLEAQDRLASLGLLSASVAHEMNTPLAVLHGSIEKLLETAPSQPAKERLERMLRVTQRLRSISEGLVDFARVRQQTMEKVLLGPLLQEAWSLVCIDEKAGTVTFDTSLDRDLTVTGNADRLIQVFVNLLRNALEAVSSGGLIRANASRLEKDAAHWVVIRIEDSGPGIPPDVLPTIFDAFVSTRLDAKGTGLGLTVAAGIVQQHGGNIQAGNCPSGGARLQVTLPA